MQNSYDSKIPVKDDGENRKGSNTKVLSRTTIANLGKIKNDGHIMKLDHSKDKELINKGLQKLVSSFNTGKILNKASRASVYKKIEHTKTPNHDSISERPTESHIVLTKQISSDKYTMTDLPDTQRKINFDTTALNEEGFYDSMQFRDLQWTDPRLLKKYSLVQKPYKKSLTVPFSNNSECGLIDRNNETDDEVEELPEVIYSNKENVLLNVFYYFCTSSVFFIGSMCGITLITLVLWKMLDENILDLQLKEPVKTDLFFKRHLKNVVTSMIHLISTVCAKILRILTISRNEVFENKEEENESWYKVY